MKLGLIPKKLVISLVKSLKISNDNLYYMCVAILVSSQLPAPISFVYLISDGMSFLRVWFPMGFRHLGAFPL